MNLNPFSWPTDIQISVGVILFIGSLAFIIATVFKASFRGAISIAIFLMVITCGVCSAYLTAKTKSIDTNHTPTKSEEVPRKRNDPPPAFYKETPQAQA